MVNIANVIRGVVILTLIAGEIYVAQMFMNWLGVAVFVGVTLLFGGGVIYAAGQMQGGNRSSGDYGTNRESKGQRR
ncbi:MAG: hypothetical protein ABEI52_07140 [Halobacteriaceae archaeon]